MCSLIAGSNFAKSYYCQELRDLTSYENIGTKLLHCVEERSR